MVEAFRRHIPLWAILTAALVAAIIVVYFIYDGNRTVQESQEPTQEESTEEAPASNDITLREVASGLNAPADIVSTGIDGDERLFVVEQSGVIRILDNGRIHETPLLDISGDVIFDGEQGLLGLAFDPDLESRQFIYINYVRPAANGRETVIARYALDENQTQADTNSRREIMTVSQPFANHNGGDLAFGLDGYLYISLGDGGSAGDPQNNAQDINTRLGKLLRVDVTGEPYSIPGDNPFTGQPGLDEIWAYGLRNPWRISFDSDGNLWMGDVGQGEFEEINFQPAGEGGQNYGWRCYEAESEYNLSGGCGDASEYTMPVASYAHEGSGCTGSVTGGYVYEGEDYPGLTGDYFFADYCTGDVYRLDSQEPEADIETVLETDYGITTFGADTHGELYLADVRSGTIYQIVAE